MSEIALVASLAAIGLVSALTWLAPNLLSWGLGVGMENRLVLLFRVRRWWARKFGSCTFAVDARYASGGADELLVNGPQAYAQVHFGTGAREIEREALESNRVLFRVGELVHELVVLPDGRPLYRLGRTKIHLSDLHRLAAAVVDAGRQLKDQRMAGPLQSISATVDLPYEVLGVRLPRRFQIERSDVELSAMPEVRLTIVDARQVKIEAKSELGFSQTLERVV